MENSLRISAEETRARVAGENALLVCSYESEEKFAKVRLEGAIPLSEFRARLASLAQDQEIIFYCA